MTEPKNHVCPKVLPSKSDVSGALSVSWARAARSGKGAMADFIETSTKTIDRALTGDSLPSLDKALASLKFNHGALDEVLALYGFGRPPRLEGRAANDLSTVSELSGLVSTFCDALSDGTRDHTETLAIADLVRAIMPALTDILDEANSLRGVRVAS